VTSPPTRTGQIYLFRGLIGLMTPSMDQFARELRVAGFSAFSYEDVLGHSVVVKIERDCARAGEHEPIILLGYSSGSVTALAIAKRLHRSHIPVDLLITLDPPVSETVPENVRVCLNFYVRMLPGVLLLSGARIKAGPTVQLENIQITNANHFTLGENPEMKAAVTARIVSVCSKRPRNSAIAQKGLVRSTTAPAQRIP